MSRPILVTAALPYANGSIHLGHMVEHIQTDIYVRYLRSSGRDAVFLCADDTHGTPIEVNARKKGISPEEFIGQFYEEHQKDFRDFGIEHAYYGSTNYPENKTYADLIFKRLSEKSYIEKRQVEQYYCEKDKRFLPDRFIKGTCPNCKSPNQYGDVCEVCGKTYSPTDLINPECSLCGTPPVRKNSAHYFVSLGKFSEFLKQWTSSGTLDPAVRNGLQPWFEKGLEDWDISRDGPYFGFKIPGEDDKYYYVWLDAPIGYISTTERWLKPRGADALRYWARDADAEIIHVIGKDIVYFHTLFWPAMLEASNFKLPSKVIVHGMLTLNGEKMSKTRGTFINARQYLDKLDPAYLRYFFAASLGPSPEDIDLSLEEFRNRVNAELVNNIGNLANRALSMIARDFGGVLADDRQPEGVPFTHADSLAAKACGHYEKLEFRDAVRTIAEIGSWANKHLADNEPWKKLKGSAEDKARAHRDLSFATEVCYRLGALLEPIVPGVAANLFNQIGAPRLDIASLRKANGPLLPKGHKIGTPAPLVPRLEAKQVEALIQPVQAEPEKPKPAKPEKAAKKAEPSGPPPEITYDDFAKLELRAGRVLACERVEKTDKLLKFAIDLGEPQPRTIISGIAKHYAPEQLVGKQVAIVANLAPRLFKNINLTSHGMILSAATGEGDNERLRVVEVSLELPPGSLIK